MSGSETCPHSDAGRRGAIYTGHEYLFCDKCRNATWKRQPGSQLAMMRTLAILALATALAACDKDRPRPRPQPPEPRSAVWTIGPIIDGQSYSPGMPHRSDGSFAFPRCSDPVSPKGPSVHYVTRPAPTRLSGTMSLTFGIVGDGALVATEGSKSARVRLYLQRRGDDWAAENGTEFYRWWSTDFVELEPGRHTLMVPLTHDRWTAVLGKGAEGPFKAALQSPLYIGFTFGGQFAGHGVCATSGEARFVLRGFAVQ